MLPLSLNAVARFLVNCLAVGAWLLIAILAISGVQATPPL